MPVAKGYTKSQWDAFASALDALPEKPDNERKVSMREAMREMRVRVRAAQAKGYTLEQIAEQGRQHGIDMTAGSIRYALRPAGKSGGAARTVPGTREAASGSRPAQPAVTRAQDAQAQTRHVRKDGGKTEVRRQPPPVQGTLGFVIQPDTDDL